MTTGLVYLIGAILALCLIIWSFWYYGKGQRRLGQQEGKNEALEEYDKMYSNVADDVLNGGHPFGVQNEGKTEIAYPELDSGVRIPSDLQREGGEGRPHRNGDGSA